MAIFAGLAHPIPDLGWVGLKLGEQLARHHSPAPPDFFSYLPVSSGWWDVSWLWNLISYGLYTEGGEIALRASAGLLAALLAVLVCRISCGPKPAALSIVLPFLLMMSLKESLAFQPMLAGMSLFAAQTLLIEKRKGRPVAFFLLYLVWAQTGHSFVVGLTYLFVCAIAEKSAPRKQYIAWALSALIGAMPSPTMWHFITRPSSMAVIFEPTADYHNIFNQLQALAVFSGLAGAAYRREKSGRTAALAALTVLGLIAGEYFPFAVIAAAPLIFAAVRQLGEELRLSSPVTGGIAVILLLISLKLLVPQKPYFHYNEEKLFSFLGGHAMFGQIFAPWNISGRVGFVTGKKIAIDARPGLYRGEAAGIYAELSRMDSSSWDDLARRLSLGGVIVSNSRPEYRFMAMKPDWALAFELGNYAFFVRDEGLNLSLLDRWGRPKPRVAERGTPEELARNLRERALDWEKKGNPYRARWAWLTILAKNPNDGEAGKSLEGIERRILEGGRGR